MSQTEREVQDQLDMKEDLNGGIKRQRKRRRLYNLERDLLESVSYTNGGLLKFLYKPYK